MKKKLNIFLIILLTSFNCLYSIGFGFHTFDIRTSPEFSKGVFPTSLLYQFDFPVPDFIQGNTTEINYRIDNGLDFRTIRQDPETGLPFASNHNKEEWNYPKDYITIYDEMNMVFGQGFLKNPMDGKDLLKLWGTFDIRFENAYERLNYLNDKDNTEGLFITKGYPDKTERFTSWVGQPELEGSRSRSNVSFSLGLDVNAMYEDYTIRNGVKNSFWIRLNPAWTDWFKDGTHDFVLFWNKLDLSWTPVAIKMNGKRDTYWFTMVLDNSTTYRFITGDKVPYYAQGGHIFGTQALNTEHVLTNRTALTFYGPQINSYDCFPYISCYVDVGLSAGKLLNTINPISYTDFIGSVGMKAQFNVFNIASFYYEIGYIFDNVLDESKNMITRFGFSFGV